MCTRVFCCENSTAKVAGRTLDASFLDVPHLWWLPAGQVRKAHPDRDWTWTSKYASLTIAEWQDAAVDGMNDHGLGVLGSQVGDTRLIGGRPPMAEWRRSVL